MHDTKTNLWSISLKITATSIFRSNSDENSTISVIPPMLRRRLSPLARMVFQVASAVKPINQDTRFVFASRHGEINSCLNMLYSLAEQQALSPAAFSHSVHNAIPGLWSIHHKQKGESSSISAGKDTFAMACLEAQLMLAEQPDTPVIIVVADEKLPNIFEQFEPEPTEPYALALLLESGTANLQLSAVKCTKQNQQHSVANVPTLEWQNWWGHSTRELEQNGERNSWRWQKISCD